MADDLCGFNMSFDHFQLCKLYSMLSLWPDQDMAPEEVIEEMALLEPQARDGPCLKPRSALDLMLHARKGPYQSTMDRGEVRIKRVPTPLVFELAKELERRIPLKDIYFARRKDKWASKWQVFDLEDADGEPIVDFKDIVLKFNPSTALKALAVDALGIKQEDVLLFQDVEIDRALFPVELEYAPFALAIGEPGNWRGTWPDRIRSHIAHWLHHKRAREYARDDVRYLQMLYERWRPEHGDDDSILACMVGAVRWRGYRLDLEGIKKLKAEAEERAYKTGKDGKLFKIPTAPHVARWYVTENMSDDEKIVLEGSTKKVLLEEISRWKVECGCDPEAACGRCDNTRVVRHPAAERAQDVLDARFAAYESNFFGKLLVAGRLQADFVVIGALSSRMSGRSSARQESAGMKAKGINVQGIKKEAKVRNKFPLSWPGYTLCGGDFAAFEVTLAEASYNDPALRKALLTCEKCGGEMRFYREKLDILCTACGSSKGKKIHALFGMSVYPGMTYEEIKATEGTADDRYTNSKRAVFAILYGAEFYTLMGRLGVSYEAAQESVRRFHAQFPGVAKAQREIEDKFQSMRQPGGIGSRVEWHKPADYIESMFGFRRYFTLENMICKALYDLANDPPPAWRDLKIKVQRRDRMQTVSGAVQSALFAAAFALQAANTRAAKNHVIQSSGATTTKGVQRAIWDLQPSGVSEWLVQPMNIHDEVICPVRAGMEQRVKETVIESVESFRPKVPLIKMDWSIGMNTWADKG